MMKRPKMTISGELQILLKPMSEPAKNTSTVVFTIVPFLKVQQTFFYVKVKTKGYDGSCKGLHQS